MKRGPNTITCPACGFWRVLRRNRRCRRCGVLLIYANELYPTGSEGYFWDFKAQKWWPLNNLPWSTRERGQ